MRSQTPKAKQKKRRKERRKESEEEESEEEEAEEGSSLTIAQQLKEAGYKWKPV